MKIKRYIVKDMKEALTTIKEDLSPDAVIISSQKVRAKGIKGFFMSKQLEVTAAVDEEHIKKTKNRYEIYDKNVSQEVFTAEEVKYLKELLDKEKLEKNKQQGQEQDQDQDRTQIQTQEQEQKQEKNRGRANSTLEMLRASMLDLEFDPGIIEEILKDYQEKIERKDAQAKRGSLELKKASDDISDINDRSGSKDTKDIDLEVLTEVVANLLKPITREDQKSNILAFVGPPGVGKTTILAKLGAHFSLIENVEISLITIDTYRIGAVQQLETYGEIMNVSVDVVFSPQELKEAVEKNKDKDIILIDTAGRPSKNTYQILEIKSYLDVLDSVETYLVLSSVTKDKDLLRMVDDYKALDYSKIIFTKTDETEVLGSIINTAHKTQLPIAYITNGQNVPDDIEVGDPASIAKLILEGAKI